MDHIGRHLLIDLWGCRHGLDDCEAVRTAIVDAVAAVGATLVELNVHPFSPCGVTGVAVLAESHMSIHTWPEHGYLAADIYTCGTQAEPRNAVPILLQAFDPEEVDVQNARRGVRKRPSGTASKVHRTDESHSPPTKPYSFWG